MLSLRRMWFPCAAGYFIYALFSVPVEPQPYMKHMIFYLTGISICFSLGFLFTNLGRFWIWFHAFIAANFLLVLFDKAYHDVWLWGILGNPNYMGCFAALSLIAAISYQQWYYVPMGLIALGYSQSRGAIVATALTIALTNLRRHHLLFVGVALLALSVLFFTKTSGGSLWQRLGIWQDTLNHLTLFGHGWGSFESTYAKFAIKTNVFNAVAPHAYNDFLEQIFTLGIGAIPLFFLIAYAYEHPGPDRAVLTCFLLLGLTYFPFWIFPLGQIFALILGVQLKGVIDGKMETSGPALPERTGHRMGIH